jgi:hypothetical protein
MAKMEVVPVLAVARRSLQIRNEMEMRELPLKNDKGEPAIDRATGKQMTTVVPVWIPVYCEPGTIIDVSDWTNAGAYENRGEIQILGPMEAKEAWAALKAERAEDEKVERGRRKPPTVTSKQFAANEKWAGRKLISSVK